MISGLETARPELRRMGRRVLILGGSGMLGHKLAQALAEQHRTYATFRTEPDPAVLFTPDGIEASRLD